MFIGMRLSYVSMEEVLGHPVRVLNEKLTKIIRSAGVKKGVPATRGGMKWFLYSVDYEEYNSLIDPKMATFIGIKHSIGWVPLVGMTAIDVDSILNQAKNKHMNNCDRHAYDSALIEGFSACIEVLNNEVKLPRKRRKK
jgi:hypothetical protein